MIRHGINLRNTPYNPSKFSEVEKTNKQKCLDEFLEWYDEKKRKKANAKPN